MSEAAAKPSLKERALDELKTYWVITLYLWLFLGSFAAYRKLILAETGVTYVHFGLALVQALIIAKVVLIGRLFGFSRRFEDGPLIWPVLYKSVLFALLVMGFGVVEHLVEGWIHHKGAPPSTACARSPPSALTRSPRACSRSAWPSFRSSASASWAACSAWASWRTCSFRGTDDWPPLT